MKLPAEDRTSDVSLSEFHGGLQFSDVSFSYTPQKKILEHLSFQILPNSLTLLKGPSGTGKTTVLKLLQKIQIPQEGKILFDDTNYDILTPFQIRKEVVLVSMDTPLLGGTVFKAVSYNTAEEKRDKVKDMLRSLNIRLAQEEDANLQFKLEEGGRNISAGERIMLQFARAFLTRKKVLLIDDVFPYLDGEQRKIIIDRINKLREKRTIVLVSQSVVEQLHPDQIIQL